MNIKMPSVAIFLALATLQASALEAFSIHGIKPSFIFIIIYALSITGGEWRGLVYGASGGFIEDCLSGGYVGLFMSAYAIAGYVAGKLGRKVVNVGESANFAGIFVLSIGSGLYISAVLEALHGGSGMLVRMARLALPQALYNAAAGAALLWLFRKRLDRRAPWMKVINELGLGRKRWTGGL